MGWRAWTRAVADELAQLGRPKQSTALRMCGAVSQVYTCSQCGDPFASVVLRRLPCDVRVCVVCARQKAQVDAERYTAAAERVPGYVAARLDVAIAVTESERAAREAQRRQTARAVLGAARARRDLYDLRAARAGRAGWRWRLVTISPAWEPADAWGYGVEGLRARAADAWARWERVWDLISCPLASALARMELSLGGHLHIHALVYGPFRRREALAARAGCIVDVRSVDTVRERDERGQMVERVDLRGAVREAVKYAAKAPSPTRGAWFAGSHFATMHPALAARWTVATQSKHLTRNYGLFRDALAAVDACEPKPQEAPACDPGRVCASCGCTTEHTPRRVATALVARALGKRWSWSGRGGKLALPPRVSIEIARGDPA